MNIPEEESFETLDQRVIDSVDKRFLVLDHFYDQGRPIFIVDAKGEGFKGRLIKEAFVDLTNEIREYGYLPQLKWIVDRYYIYIIKKEASGEENYKWNLYLFIATVGFVMLDGYLRSNNPILTEELMRGTHPLFNAALFTFAIITIFGVHEMGHKAVSIYRGVDASMPYFIPAPPGMGGTLGAVITQREPPVNRDALWDLGIAGPLAGFFMTLIISVIGASLSFVVPETEIFGWMFQYPAIRFQEMPMPLMLDLVLNWLKPAPEGYALIMHPVAFAAWVGCLVTFINLIPSWQLDGGHIMRAFVGRESHKIISIAGILILVVSGYFVMGVMVAFFMMRQGNESMTPLDDLSPLSFRRKIGMVLYLALIGFCLIALLPF